jgi:hypothetical protein
LVWFYFYSWGRDSGELLWEVKSMSYENVLERIVAWESNKHGNGAIYEAICSQGEGNEGTGEGFNTTRLSSKLV